MRRQRYSHTYSVHDDLEQVRPDDLNSYDSMSVQTSQETSWLNLNYDWYSSLFLQSLYSTEQSSTVLNPYQYNYVFMNPIIEELQNLSDSYSQSLWQELASYQYLDPYNALLSMDGSGFPLSQIEYGEEQQPYEEDLQSQVAPLEIPNSCPMVTAYGTIAVLLRHCVRVDITPDRAIYLSNFPGRCIASMNSMGDKSCIIHPSGKMLQDGITVHTETGNRIAKISRRGVTFTSLDHSLAYLVDASGTKSTAERFRNLQHDFSLEVFYSNSLYGQQTYEECMIILATASYRFYDNGDEAWTIGGVRIKQNQWGDVRVSRNYGRRVLRTSPTIGTVSVSTPLIHMAASCDPHRYFFVRRGDKQISAHVGGFNVKNGSQKAGFDRKGRLVIH